jgi:cyclopropane-fatty-acyl-phospholipid synthase
MVTQSFAPAGAPASAAAAYRALAYLLEPADIALGGSRPWDIVVHDPRMPARVLAQGSLGAGESYMEGGWDCERLDEMFTRVLRSGLDHRLRTARALRMSLLALLRNPQNLRRAFIVGRAHYDIGDDLFQRMLDPRMIYSCAWWQGAGDLAGAQEAKLDLVCRKLGLERGMRVLDIGCGWGGAAQFAASRYGVTVTGITVSRHQAAAAIERCRGLPVEVRLEDYRRHSGSYDRIWSLGMFEHVGARNYRAYLRKVRSLLAPDGLFLLHTIGANRSSSRTDPWIEKYIFPNSMLPSIAQIARAAERLWVIEDWHGFGPHYDRTLLAWHRNFEARWPDIAARYGERFHRMWRYWLLSSAASFRARRNQLWQFVFSPRGVPGGYQAVR